MSASSVFSLNRPFLVKHGQVFYLQGDVLFSAPFLSKDGTFFRGEGREVWPAVDNGDDKELISWYEIRLITDALAE